MPLYDFKCSNQECTNYNVHVEELCKVGAIAQCSLCSLDMQKIILPPDGKRNPHPSWSQWRVGLGLNDKA